MRHVFRNREVLRSLFFCLLLALLLPGLSGCVKKTVRSDPLPYQVYPFSIVCSGSGNDLCGQTPFRVRLTMTAAQTGSLEFLLPETLLGVTFFRENGQDTLLYSPPEGSAALPIRTNLALSGITALTELFSLDPTRMTEVEVDTVSGKTVNIASFRLNENRGDVRIWMDSEQGIPLHMEACLDGHTVKLDLSEYCRQEPSS